MNLEQAVEVVRELYNIPFELKSEQMDIIRTIVEKDSVIWYPANGFRQDTYVRCAAVDS